MMRRFWSGALLVYALIPLSLTAQQTAVPLGTSDAPYGYYEYLPDGYPGIVEWPVVIFLHGLGERGNGTSQLSRVLALGLPANVAQNTDYPFLLISPQAPEYPSGDWDVSTLDAMVEFVKSHYQVNPDRIYMTGISLGGGGTWNYAKAHPEKLAAILPLSGSPTVKDGSKLVDLPTWAFHAWNDENVNTPSTESIGWVDAIAAARSNTTSDVMASYPGSSQDRTASFSLGTGWSWQTGVVPPGTDDHPNLTLYASTSHDTWTPTYANQDVLDWLLDQERDSGPCDPRTRRIVPEDASVAGGGYFPLQNAFDAPPAVSKEACEPLGGSGGSDAPALSSKVGYIDFGPDWQNVRITATWTRYRAWSLGNQTPYDELWWDDDTDATNDSGLDETYLSFNSAQDLDTGPAELWVRDRDLRDDPVTPQARHLLLRTSSGTVSDRAREYAILGYTEEIEEVLIEPTSAGTASGSIYYPMDDAFDGQPTLDGSGAPAGGTGGDQAPYLAGRAGYIDFGPEWYKVRITQTWTRYRTWSLGDQTPYAALWWDDDTDSVNDSGLDETDINFNTATGLDTGLTEPWLQDRDLNSPVIPQARYLLCLSPSNMTDRAQEYAIIGIIDPDATP